MLGKISSDFINSNVLPSVIKQFSRKFSHETHYEVLNLPRDCSNRQIKSAFIRLSKKHHPDVNKSEQSHSKFLKINEAYKVLGKSETRRNYDLGLPTHSSSNTTSSTTEYVIRKNPYEDQSFWINRDKASDKYYKNKAYYGVEGVKKVSNGTVAMLCIIAALIGVGLQLIAISLSVTFKREEMIRKSLENAKILEAIRQKASLKGNEAQMEALKAKLSEITKDNEKK